MKKFAISGLIVIFAVFFGTCVPELPEGGEDGVEYTSVEYELAGDPGSPRVKSIKLYLDGASVPVTPHQRAVQRALSLESAKGSHDYFEAVFQGGSDVARASWEIGYPAGIRGVWRNGTAGCNYGNLNATPAAGTGNAVVFVGNKTTKTLLAVGILTFINDSTTYTTTINNLTTSVTFSVVALKTWVGFDGGETPVLRVGSAHDAPTGEGTLATFTTTNTPLGQNIYPEGAEYPLFLLPPPPDDLPAITVTGTYTIGGLSGSPVTAPTGANAVTTLWPAVRNYGAAGGNGLQVMKRTPRFITGGRTFRAGEIYDRNSQITLSTAYMGTNPANGQFGNAIGLTISVYPNSRGIFAFTFQAPVYAITTDESSATNVTGGGPKDAEKWFIRPAEEAALYLLDNGQDDGGMVMLGSVSGGGLDDFIQIITTGIGFDNE